MLMNVRRLAVLLTASLASFGFTQEPTTALIYKVVGSGINDTAAQAIQNSLALKGDPHFADNVLRYLDPFTFQQIPRKYLRSTYDPLGRKTAEYAYDFAAASRYPLYDAKMAISRLYDAFKAAEVPAPPHMGATYTHFELVPA